jgi:hypothetical protein
MIATMPQAAYTRSIDRNMSTSVATAAFSLFDETEKWAPVVRALLELVHLKDDWDGEGSEAPRREIVTAAIRLATVLRDRGDELPASAVASRAGTVIFTWRDGRHYQEIEVVSLNRFEWMTVDSTGKTAQGEFLLR